MSCSDFITVFRTVYSYLLGPDSVETMTRKEYKEEYGYDAQFKNCY